ncbi:MAG: prepilin-type N-terminal cleavage/methylation domain-containing protein [Candidatus Thiodiazotropha sp. 6PLUC2]
MCYRPCVTDRHYRIRRSHGFTLVELIIALVLMSLIMVLLFSGLDLGRRSWQTTAATSERQSNQRLAFDFLQRSISGMYNETLATEEGLEPLFFGSEDLLRWVGPTAAQAGPGGASLFRLELLGKEEEKLLLLKRWLYHPEVLEEEPEAGRDWRASLASEWTPADQDVATIRYSEHLLLHGLTEVELAYYGSLQRGIPDEWHREWQDSEKLPRMIRIRLHYKNRVSPPLTITVRAAQG